MARRTNRTKLAKIGHELGLNTNQRANLLKETRHYLQTQSQDEVCKVTDEQILTHARNFFSQPEISQRFLGDHLSPPDAEQRRSKSIDRIARLMQCQRDRKRTAAQRAGGTRTDTNSPPSGSAGGRHRQIALQDNCVGPVRPEGSGNSRVRRGLLGAPQVPSIANTCARRETESTDNLLLSTGVRGPVGVPHKMSNNLDSSLQTQRDADCVTANDPRESLVAAHFEYKRVFYGFKSLEDKTDTLEALLRATTETIDHFWLRPHTSILTRDDRQRSKGARDVRRRLDNQYPRILSEGGRVLDMD
ncbi:hypothetical protein LTR70_009401 [Exophiala xenobiotica]|uniref:Uncharacterized protein n=1 Tax=Lithohypha guttulata TaxID=1690604 RepID=A0ABR0JXC4_9EURO|nr:hypothetical protein LTR24_009318 [Lithohypha guttulata]KAK5310538.1 hypothetical protein LTR70_009401 [Exophiala xenobiotica]